MIAINAAEYAGINLNPYQGLKQMGMSLRGNYRFRYHAGINLNPYQGLKQWVRGEGFKPNPAGINLNPYQGLKLIVWRNTFSVASCRNQPKSLSGIETNLRAQQKLAENLSRNQPKSLSGIETIIGLKSITKPGKCRNQPKSLSGIETLRKVK